MKILIVITTILSAYSVHCEYTSCKSDKSGVWVCKKPAEITHIDQTGNSTELVLKLKNDITLAPNAFENVNLSTLYITFYTDFKYNREFSVLVIKPGSFMGLSNLKKLTIEHANIILNGNPFAPLGSLVSLKFIYTTLEEVPPGITETSPNLEELSFEGNRIRVLHPNAFSNLKNLKFLDMSDNTMHTLEPGCFNGLHELETLLLGPNSLPATPILTGLSKLKKLDLSYNFAINRFESAKFSAVPELSEIIMYDIYLNSLDPGMFGNLPRLKIIRFRGNKFTIVKKNVFNNLKLLEYLDLSSSDIVKIETDAFYGLNLTTLDLNSLRIDSFETGAFNGLTVGKLTFHHSSINRMEPFAFNKTSAQVVDLEACRLSRINLHDFSGLRTEELLLGWNDITWIQPDAFLNTSIERINLKYNPITPMKDIWGLPESVEIVQ